MKPDFLLSSETALRLYDSVKNLPVIDYHNHLPANEILTDKRFFDIYEMWVQTDPYKHRAMRMCGVAEKYITGDAPQRQKFSKWCEALPKLIGTPLYQWAVMEVSALFGVDELPDGNSADEFYDRCNLYLKENKVSASSMLRMFNVRYACPCASIVDDISAFAGSPLVAPSLRGDDVVNVTSEFVESLSRICGKEITELTSFKKALTSRLECFRAARCKFSDHALDNGFEFFADDGKNGERFEAMMQNSIDEEDAKRLSSYILEFLGNEYSRLGFVMQLHIGAQRRTSTRLKNAAGPAGGYASIGNSVNADSLTKFLDTLDMKNEGLPKTVLFTLNPADNALISVLSGSYSRDGVAGLITQGPAWWWCDHKYGITEMLENTASFGLLYNFIGMTTDSRSFLSFVRHDYFRRILCDWLGAKFESGDFCTSFDSLKKLAYAMCFGNAGQICNEE